MIEDPNLTRRLIFIFSFITVLFVTMFYCGQSAKAEIITLQVTWEHSGEDVAGFAVRGAKDTDGHPPYDLTGIKLITDPEARQATGRVSIAEPTDFCAVMWAYDEAENVSGPAWSQWIRLTPGAEPETLRIRWSRDGEYFRQLTKSTEAAVSLRQSDASNTTNNND